MSDPKTETTNLAEKNRGVMRDPYVESYEKRKKIYAWCCKVAAWLHVMYVMASKHITHDQYDMQTAKTYMNTLASNLPDMLRAGSYVKASSRGTDSYLCDLVDEIEAIKQGSYYDFDYLSKIILEAFIKLHESCVDTKKTLPHGWTRDHADKVYQLKDLLESHSNAENIIDAIRANEVTIAKE